MNPMETNESGGGELDDFGMHAVTNHFRHASVFFITSGYDVPYSPLEKGIVDSLAKLVGKLFVLKPEQDLQFAVYKEKPVLAIIFGGFQVTCYQVQMLRAAGVKTAIWMTDDPYVTDKTKQFAPYYDIVFTQEMNCVPFYKALGCRHVYYLPLAADHHVFYPREVGSSYHTDIFFVGSAYHNRIALFDQISDYLATKHTMICGIGWDKLKSYRLLRKKVYSNYWMTPEETASYYNGAKIVLNMHRSYDDTAVNQNSERVEAASFNPRTFEISACGAFQLTDIRPELTAVYTPGYHIDTYTTAGELVEKMEYYLHHEQERKDIAARAYEHIAKTHTFSHRVGQLLVVVISI